MELFIMFLGTFVKFAAVILIITVVVSIIAFITAALVITVVVSVFVFITAEDFINYHPIIAVLGIIVICFIGIGVCAFLNPQYLHSTIRWAIIISTILGLGIGINILANCILYDTKDIFRAKFFQAICVLGITALSVAFLTTLHTSVKMTTENVEYQVPENTAVSIEGKNILDSIDINTNQNFKRILPNCD